MKLIKLGKNNKHQWTWIPCRLLVSHSTKATPTDSPESRTNSGLTRALQSVPKPTFCHCQVGTCYSNWGLDLGHHFKE